MLTFSLGVACGAKRFDYFMSKMRCLVFLTSRDIENSFFLVKMIQIEIFNVFGRWKYEFLRICKGPDRARSPQDPTRAQGRAQGRAQSPGEGPGEGPTRAQGPRRA